MPDLSHHTNQDTLIIQQRIGAGDEQAFRQLFHLFHPKLIQFAYALFDGDNFREMADRMERWFNVKITFHDPAVARYRFHVGFENENINEVLAALQVSAPFTFKINHNEVDIYKKWGRKKNGKCANIPR